MAFEEHFQEHEIEAYLLNNLSADESIVIEEHIMICPTCVSKAEEVGSQIALIRHAFDSLREQKPSGALVDRPIAVFQN